MFNVGDLIIYSGHGICKVDDICEKSYAGITKNYYVLHPLENSQQLTISTPVDTESVVMVGLINKDEAEEILYSFQAPGINWIEKPNFRFQVYNDIIKTGNRKEIAKVVNTLIQKKHDLQTNGKKLYEQDNKLLIKIQNILFKELAISLNTSYEEISAKIDSILIGEKNTIN
jgi:CarD family transcriptional regulator